MFDLDPLKSAVKDIIKWLIVTSLPDTYKHILTPLVLFSSALLDYCFVDFSFLKRIPISLFYYVRYRSELFKEQGIIPVHLREAYSLLCMFKTPFTLRVQGGELDSTINMINILKSLPVDKNKYFTISNLANFNKNYFVLTGVYNSYNEFTSPTAQVSIAHLTPVFITKNNSIVSIDKFDNLSFSLKAEHRQDIVEFVDFINSSKKNENDEQQCITYFRKFAMSKTDSLETMDNYISIHKDIIIQALDNLKFNNSNNNHNPYKNRNLGIMLHGKPGCGKSTLVHRIANYLKRPIIYVNVAQISNTELFDLLLSNSCSTGNIIVFEEFDHMMKQIKNNDNNVDNNVTCNDEKSNVQDNDNKQEIITKEVESYTKMLYSTKDEQHKKMLMGRITTLMSEMGALKDKIDLGTLLSMLQGSTPMTNRVIIASTNHIDKIDSALLRPGRFDLVLHLEPFTRDELIELVVKFYDDSSLHAKFMAKYNDIADKHFTPAVLLQMCQMYTVDEMLDKVCK